MSHGEGKFNDSGGEEGNLAAWLVAVKTLKIQPYDLPSLDSSQRRSVTWLTSVVSKQIYTSLNLDQVVHPANLCFKLPDNVSLEEGAMCEPLSVGVHACRRAEVSPQTKVLIMGAGPIGLVTMLSARAFGSPKIVIADVDNLRLSFAKDLGADEDVDDDVAKIKEAIGGTVDVSFDCVGFNKTMSTALNATRSGGKVCLVGLGQSEMTLPLTPAAQTMARLFF